MEILRMPMMQTPFPSILAIRLRAHWLVEVPKLTLVAEGLQDEVEDDDDGVETKHAKRVKTVELRLKTGLRSATNDVLTMVSVTSKCCLGLRL